MSSNTPFLKKEDHARYFNQHLLEESPKQHYFLIRDPFNNTYNPAKNLHVVDDRERVKAMFREAYNNLI